MQTLVRAFLAILSGSPAADFVFQPHRLVEQNGRIPRLLPSRPHSLPFRRPPSPVSSCAFLLSPRTQLVIVALTLVHLLIDLQKYADRRYPAFGGSSYIGDRSFISSPSFSPHGSVASRAARDPTSSEIAGLSEWFSGRASSSGSDLRRVCMHSFGRAQGEPPASFNRAYTSAGSSDSSLSPRFCCNRPRRSA